MCVSFIIDDDDDDDDDNDDDGNDDDGFDKYSTRPSRGCTWWHARM